MPVEVRILSAALVGCPGDAPRIARGGRRRERIEDERTRRSRFPRRRAHFRGRRDGRRRRAARVGHRVLVTVRRPPEHLYGMTNWWQRSHPVFRLLLIAVLLAVVAALVLDDSSRPGVALGSGPLHRLAVFFCILALAYAALMVLWLAYQGRWASVQVPAIGGGVQPADEIDQAADSLEELRRVTQERLDTHDEVLEQLRDRLTALEER
jgi:hypothetical protein